MAISYRKRKKTFFGFLNLAMSEENGASGSASMKISDNITHNFGSVGGKRKRKAKTTVRLGKGLKWIIPW